MPDIWAELDADAIAQDEIKATITLALVALRRGQTPPMVTPLQRTVAHAAMPIWRDYERRQIRAQVNAIRARVRH